MIHTSDKRLVARLGVAAFLAAAVPTVATAAGYENLGSGSISCGQWLEHRRATGAEERRMVFDDEDWVMGFITGRNAGAAATTGSEKLSHTGKETGSASMFAWIDNYCRANPLKDLANAADALWLTLSGVSK